VQEETVQQGHHTWWNGDGGGGGDHVRWCVKSALTCDLSHADRDRELSRILGSVSLPETVLCPVTEISESNQAAVIMCPLMSVRKSIESRSMSDGLSGLVFHSSLFCSALLWSRSCVK
jgi:hypothetical protein